MGRERNATAGRSSHKIWVHGMQRQPSGPRSAANGLGRVMRLRACTRIAMAWGIMIGEDLYLHAGSRAGTLLVLQLVDPLDGIRRCTVARLGCLGRRRGGQ